MITLVGVGHVFRISDQVRSIIVDLRPSAVCVELDPYRYHALRQERRGRGDVSLAYRFLALFQRRMAKQFGGEVGQEMLAAVDAAREVGGEVLFIDIDATSMFSRLWEEMPLKEKVMLVGSAAWSFLLSKEKVEKELESFQDNEEEYMRTFSDQFPTLKKVLIDERNETMASRIAKAEEMYGSVLAVIGDGHVDGVSKLLEEREVRVTRLKELRAMTVDRTGGGGNAEARMHFYHP